MEERDLVDLDPTALLFAGERKAESKPTTKRSQTPLPLIAGHHGRRRPGRERPAGSPREEKLKPSTSPQGYSREEETTPIRQVVALALITTSL
jgi:hypothetical protein